MRKITFENEVNGLSVTFASDTPKMLLESFDGCSCGSEAITYRPLNYDGQRFVSSTLTARTIQFTVSVCGSQNGKHSREDALEKWSEISRVFTPGDIGTLTWTDGTKTRFIKCRAEALPMPTEVLPFLFRIEFSLVADNPLWFDSVEKVIPFTSNLEIYNPCGIPVPFMLDVESDPSQVAFAIRSDTLKKILMVAVFKTNESFTVDMANCTVTSASGELWNHLLAINSDFFYIAPGLNDIDMLFFRNATLRWREAYLSVY